MKTLVIGADHFKLKAEVDFDGAYLGRALAPWVAEHLPPPDDPEAIARFSEALGVEVVERLASEIDRIEAELARRFPRLVHVDLEAD